MSDIKKLYNEDKVLLTTTIMLGFCIINQIKAPLTNVFMISLKNSN